MVGYLRSLSAGLALSLPLLASTPTFAQEHHAISDRDADSRPKIEIPHSLISLAPAPHPQGQALGRSLNDAKFEHVPENYHVFAAATAGEDSGTETLWLNFDGSTRLTKIESKNRDFIVESGGSCHEGNSYSKGDSCSLLVRFAAQGPGHRVGALNISHSAEPTPMFVGLTGNGYSPVVSFTPSMMGTVSGTISGSTGAIKNSTDLTVDGGDILYIPDVGNNQIKEIDSSGAIHTVSPVFATPQSLAVDSGGIIYSTNISGSTYYFSDYYPWGTQSAWGTTYAAGACTPSTPCSLSTVGMSQPANISIDPYDNLFMTERTKGAAEMPVANISGGSGTFNLWYLNNQFMYTSGTAASFAVDGSDNIYNAYIYGTTVCYLQSETAYAAEYSPSIKRVAGGSTCGFSGDGGLARSAEISTKIGQITFDVAGNLYFADAGNQRIRRIDATTGIISTIAGTGASGYTGDGNAATNASISNPTGLTVDSQGQVYMLSSVPAGSTTQVLRKISTVGYWNFSNQVKGTSSAVKVFTVANTGNSALTLSSNAFLTGSNPGDFSVDSTTTTCILSAGSTLAAGRSCSIGVKFTPGATAGRSAYLTLLDNTVTGTNRILLNGVGTLPSPTMAITSPTASSSVKTGTTVTFAVSVTSTSTTKPTGTVTFKVNGSNVGSVITLSATGTASTTFTESSAAAYSLSAVYSGDANYSTTTVSESLTVTASAVKAASTVKLATGTTAFNACGSPGFLVQVASAAGGNPTGMVQLMNGTTVVASAALTNGAVRLSTVRLPVGSHTFVASYAGDSTHEAANSAPLTLRSGPTATGSCGGGLRPIAESWHF
jgi:Bacterial Ig-like domain (group 3)